MVPVRVFTWRAAHLPKAAEAPVALTRATIMPSRMRNRKLPALPDMAGTKPSLTMAFTVSTGWKPVTKSAPTTMPTNSEL